MKSKVNHLYKDFPAVPGSVALCGHVKANKLGFGKNLPTCTPCVSVAVGKRFRKQ